MQSQEFINELHAVGWHAESDAQHTRILVLWRKLFPSASELESALREIAEHHIESHEDAYEMQNIASYCIVQD